MSNWVCNRCTARMPVGSQWCPEPSCGAIDAHEEGGDTALNVFDAVEVTEIKSPGAAWATVNEAAATVVHERRRASENVPSMREAVAVLMSRAGDVEVGERLGLVPGDPGAADTSVDPEPVYRPDADGVVEFPADGVERTADLGGESGDAAPADASTDPAPVSESESTGSAPESGRKK